MSQGALRVAIVAGEASGDNLGAGLIAAIREHVPDAEFFGIAGPSMSEAGCEPWFRTDELSVMGLAEVLRHLPRLLGLRRALVRRLAASRPDVYVGIDSPDFNLPVAAALKRAGVRTVQYVSPQIWAWRQSRVAQVRAAADLVLCVLPFETAFYESHGVNSRFIGHPLADAIPLQVDRAAARSRLGLDRDRPLLAILPGSRRAEVARLARPFLETAHWLQRQRPELATAVALASETLGELLRSACRGLELVPAPSVIAGRSRDVMAAADVVLTASGTASLEAMLLKRPMVVAYRLSPLTYWLVRRLGVGRLTHFSLPNLLAGRTVVPEFVQEQVRADVLGPAVLGYLDGNALDAGWYDVFARIHGELRCNASAAAAQAVLGLVRQETAGSGGA